MVIRLHTMDGKTRVYETHRGEGGGENGPSKYVTKCGLEWTTEPKPYETCDHIDCALDVLRRAADSGPVGFLICLVFGIFSFFMMKDGGLWALAWIGFFILMAIWALICGFRAQDNFNELTEYKGKGTIKGVRAYSAPASDELAKLNSANECVDMGLALHNTGKYGYAIKAFDRAIELNPASAKAWNSKGATHKAQRRYEEAIQAYGKAVELNPRLKEAWYDMGMALDNQGKYDEAVIAYDRALKIKPRLKEAWYNKGMALSNQSKYDEAIQAFDKAIKIDRSNADFWYNKGLALKLLGRTAEAAESLDHAKEEWNREGLDLIHLKEYFEAIRAFDMALVVDPKYDNAWINKGTACFRLGRHKEAMAAFDQVIEFDPQNADAWNRKGAVLKAIGYKPLADDAFARAKQLGYSG